MARKAGKDWVPAVRNSSKFVKHVVPAAVKPLHTLWHEVMGFIFLAFSVIVGFKIWQGRATLSIPEYLIMGVFVVVTAGYGISSVLKARRIARS